MRLGYLLATVTLSAYWSLWGRASLSADVLACQWARGLGCWWGYGWLLRAGWLSGSRWR